MLRASYLSSLSLSACAWALLCSISSAQDNPPAVQEVSGSVSINGAVDVTGSTVDIEFNQGDMSPTGYNMENELNPVTTGLANNKLRPDANDVKDLFISDPSTYYTPNYFDWVHCYPFGTNEYGVGGKMNATNAQNIGERVDFSYNFRPYIIIPSFRADLLINDCSITLFGFTSNQVLKRWTALFNMRQYKKLEWTPGNYIAEKYKQVFKGEFDPRLILNATFPDIKLFIVSCLNFFYFIGFGLLDLKIILNWR